MQKLPMRERRRRALLNSVARMRKQREEAIKTIVRCETNLPKVERRLRNYDKPPRSKPSGVVTPPPPPTIEPQMQGDGTPDFLRQAKQPEPKPADKPEPKPEPAQKPPAKRQRKRDILDLDTPPACKVNPIAPDPMTVLVGQVAREARMEQMGFRKVTRRRKAPLGSEARGLKLTPPQSRR